MRKLSGLLVEMRRRRVFRTAGLYVVAAWVALQVADVAFESWGVPTVAMRYVWIAALLGLPVALVLGWRFDIVDGRLVHAADDASDFALSRSDVLLLCALAAIFVATLLGVGAGISVEEESHDDVSRIDPKSIAVLPFDYLGGDGDGADVLALGIQDDLLTRLSRIGEF